MKKPSLESLGADLLATTWWERVSSIALPFLTCAGAFWAGSKDWWSLVLLFAVVQCFFTYASVSHDLVHRTLRLPPVANDILLSLIEGLCFRSGHAFRVTHWHHHRRFPHQDDLEGAAAHMTWWQALLDGITAQPRLWWWALRHCQSGTRQIILLEVLSVLLWALWCLTSTAGTVYLALQVTGSWIFPFMTSHLPHDPRGDSPLRQTRLFRGKVIGWLSAEHLYHLEHHLYPQVPHHRWPELARRLDSYFAEAGLTSIVLWK
jgi:beta-carotene hydroxylase